MASSVKLVDIYLVRERGSLPPAGLGVDNAKFVSPVRLVLFVI